MRDQITAVMRDNPRPMTSREICDLLGKITIRQRMGCNGDHTPRSDVEIVSCSPTGDYCGGWNASSLPVVIHVERRDPRPDHLHPHLNRLAREGVVLKTPLPRFRCNVYSLATDLEALLT